MASDIHTVFQHERIQFSFNCKFLGVASESRYFQTMFVRGSVSASYVREASIYCVDESECGLGKALKFCPKSCPDLVHEHTFPDSKLL